MLVWSKDWLFTQNMYKEIDMQYSYFLDVNVMKKVKTKLFFSKNK